MIISDGYSVLSLAVGAARRRGRGPGPGSGGAGHESRPGAAITFRTLASSVPQGPGRIRHS